MGFVCQAWQVSHDLSSKISVDDLKTISYSYRGFLFIPITFMTTHTAVMYWQVVIWKRVKEFNEELAISCISRAIYAQGLMITLVFPIDTEMELKFIGLKPMTLPKFNDPLSPFQPIISLR